MNDDDIGKVQGSRETFEEEKAFRDRLSLLTV